MQEVIEISLGKIRIGRLETMDDLFAGTEHEKVRAKRRVMMHVADAGQHNSIKVIMFECPKCSHNTGWIKDVQTISENRRGIPCPNCNK